MFHSHANCGSISLTPTNISAICPILANEFLPRLFSEPFQAFNWKVFVRETQLILSAKFYLLDPNFCFQSETKSYP